MSIPFLKASAIIKNLLGRFFSRRVFSCSFFLSFKFLFEFKPSKPISRLLTAFWNDSLKFLPIAIHSPIDFIVVPSFSSVSLNFSNVNLGIFVTM